VHALKKNLGLTLQVLIGEQTQVLDVGTFPVHFLPDLADDGHDPAAGRAARLGTPVLGMKQVGEGSNAATLADKVLGQFTQFGELVLALEHAVQFGLSIPLALGPAHCPPSDSPGS